MTPRTEGRHLDAGERAARSRAMKTLIIVTGHAGAGKTTRGRELATSTGWPLLDKDTLFGPIADDLVGPADRDSPSYLERVRPFEYTGLFDAAIEILRYGTPGVIVVAPCGRELTSPDGAWLGRIVARAANVGARTQVEWLDVDDAERRRRLEARGAARDADKLEHWAEWAASLRDPLDSPFIVRRSTD